MFEDSIILNYYISELMNTAAGKQLPIQAVLLTVVMCQKRRCYLISLKHASQSYHSQNWQHHIRWKKKNQRREEFYENLKDVCLALALSCSTVERQTISPLLAAPPHTDRITCLSR